MVERSYRGGEVVDQRPAPAEIDTSVPNGARIYDYMLGGKDHFQADEAAAEQMIAANPAAPRTARANRAFLGRAVRFLAEDAGIRQFLDLGTGLPTQQNVHEVAQAAAPDARVVYVDYDPVVVMHARALLATTDKVTVVQGDLRRPDEILARLRDAMAPGSYLVVSHTANESPDEVMAAAQQGFRLAGAPLTPRTRAEISRLLEGFDLVDPGLVEVSQWRPDAPEAPTPSGSPWTIVGAVARKP